MNFKFATSTRIWCRLMMLPPLPLVLIGRRQSSSYKEYRDAYESGQIEEGFLSACGQVTAATKEIYKTRYDWNVDPYFPVFVSYPGHSREDKLNYNTTVI